MVYDRERDRRDDAVYAEHQQAVAAGGKRVLRRTRTGELHSYPAEEIGFTPGSGHAQVSSWWGMGILVLFIAAMFIFGLMMFLGPLKDGGDSPLWGALWVMAMAAAFIPWGIKLARAEYRGKKLRRLRGSPEPGTGSLNIHHMPYDQPKKRQ